MSTLSAGFVDGRLYVIGGWAAGGIPIPSVDVFDPAAGTWSTVSGATNPRPRAAAGVGIADGKIYLVGGCTDSLCTDASDTISFDPATGTSRLKAVFDNKDSALFPNQFVNVRLLLEVSKNRLILPSQALQRGPQGNFVFIVKPDQTVEVRAVTVGNSEGAQVSVTHGLTAGESVVIDGGDKLRAGSLVRLVSKPGQGA